MLKDTLIWHWTWDYKLNVYNTLDKSEALNQHEENFTFVLKIMIFS